MLRAAGDLRGTEPVRARLFSVFSAQFGSRMLSALKEAKICVEQGERRADAVKGHTTESQRDACTISTSGTAKDQRRKENAPMACAAKKPSRARWFECRRENPVGPSARLSLRRHRPDAPSLCSAGIANHGGPALQDPTSKNDRFSSQTD